MGQSSCCLPEAALGRSEKPVDIAAHLLMDQRLDPLDRRVLQPFGTQSAASLELRRSVISIEPGAWVMQNSGFTAATAACGVTPQAQNTGSSSAPIGTASP